MALLQNEVVNTLLTIAEKADSRNTDIGQGWNLLTASYYCSKKALLDAIYKIDRNYSRGTTVNSIKHKGVQVSEHGGNFRHYVSKRPHVADEIHTSHCFSKFTS